MCVSGWTHRLFSLPLCTWIGQYVEDRRGRRVNHCQQAMDREKDRLLFVISVLYRSCRSQTVSVFVSIASTRHQLNYRNMSDSHHPCTNSCSCDSVLIKVVWFVLLNDVKHLGEKIVLSTRCFS